jgi:hypothetical protein
MSVISAIGKKDAAQPPSELVKSAASDLMELQFLEHLARSQVLLDVKTDLTSRIALITGDQATGPSMIQAALSMRHAPEQIAVSVLMKRS